MLQVLFYFLCFCFLVQIEVDCTKFFLLRRVLSSIDSTTSDQHKINRKANVRQSRIDQQVALLGAQLNKLVFAKYAKLYSKCYESYLMIVAHTRRRGEIATRKICFA